MLERDQGLIKDPERQFIAKRIEASYKGQVDFLKAINLSKKNSDICDIFAENYSVLSPTQRELAWDSALKNSKVFKYKAAYSLAKTGDFTLFDTLKNETPTYGTLTTLLGIVVEQYKQGKDYKKSFSKALKVAQDAQTLFKDREEMAIPYLEIAKIAPSIKLDPQEFVKKGVNVVKNTYYTEAFAWRLVNEGFVDQAIKFLPKKKFSDYENIRFAEGLVKAGKLEEANKFEGVQARNVKALIKAKCALKASELGIPAQKYINEAKVLLDNLSVAHKLDTQVNGYLLLAEAERNLGNDPAVYLDEVYKKVTNSDDLEDQLRLFISLIKAESILTSINKRNIVELLKTIERTEEAIIDKDTDKLDRIEFLMTLEEIIPEITSLGFVEEAKDSLARLKRAYKELGEQADSEVERMEAQIAIEQIKQAVPVDMIKSFSEEQINSLLRINDINLHLALGYFQVVNEEQFNSLSPQVQIAVLTGILQGTRALDQDKTKNVTTPLEIYKKTRSRETTKVLVEVFKDLEVGLGNAEFLRVLLEEELTIGKNYNVVCRLIKGLVEMSDGKGKEMAVDVFLDETVPTKFRLYIARKLCDSGHWDRQIIDYFKNYQHEGLNAFMANVKLDSLAAIVSQMHSTPSLQVYKILEKTRKVFDRESMLEIAKFGNQIFLLPDFDLKVKLDIFSFWSEKFESKQINSKDLVEIANCIEKLSFAQKTYCESIEKGDKKPYFALYLSHFYKQLTIRKTIDQITLLLENKILPTQELTTFAYKEKNEALKKLVTLVKATENGNFDLSNEVQRDLEFSKYLLISQDNSNTPYKNFLKLKTLEESTRKELSLVAQMEARAAAYEAAKLYHHIRELVDLGRKVRVVGNQRRGDYFIVDPLRGFLEELGVRVSSYKVSSSQTHEKTIVDIFPKAFIQSIISERQDIVIVDGSPKIFDENKNPRLPRSINGYMNWFHAFNTAAGVNTLKDPSLRKSKEFKELVKKIKEFKPTHIYSLACFVPFPKEKITIGDKTIVYKEHEGKTPVVIFSNPIISPDVDPGFPRELKNHKPDYLDDPDKYTIGEKVLGFTKHGVKLVSRESWDEKEFVQAIQTHMINILPKMILQTSPLKVTRE